MKYVLVLLVVAIGLWLLLRQRDTGAPPPSAPPRKPGKSPALEKIVACAHCELRLPRAEAVTDANADADDRYYCSEAHRLAGPR